MNHRPILALVLAALALAACSTPPQVQTWTGTTTSGGTSQPLTVEAALAPDGSWVGTYTVASEPPFSGDVVATLTGTALEGELIATHACRYDLSGTLDGDALTATFEPANCPGGATGTWSATLEP